MRTLRATLAAVVLAGLSLTTTSALAATPAVAAGPSLAARPAAAARLDLAARPDLAAAANPGAGLSSVSCSLAGSCTAVATYQNAIGEGEGVMTSETDGTWGAGVQARLPKGAAVNPMFDSSLDPVGLTQVACGAAGDCAAVGSYFATNDRIDGLLLTQSDGTWQQGVEAKAPANATTKNYEYDTDPQAVVCTSAGNCVAAGYYVDKNGNLEPVIFKQTAGKWSAGTELKLPSNAAAEGQLALLDAISCPQAGDCVAVGTYSDAAGDQLPLTETESAGVWTAYEPTLPTGTGTGAEGSGRGFAELGTVSCSSVGNCAAGGNYADVSENQDALLAVQSGGTWGAATDVTLPSGAAADAGDQDADITQTQCPSDGNCTAIGGYADSDGNEQGLLVGESGGTWSPATEASLPGTAATAVGTQSVDFTGLSCISAGNCVASGSFNTDDSDSTPTTLVDEETAGSWSTANGVTSPANVAHDQESFGGGVSCVPTVATGPSVGGAACAFVGGYVDQGANLQGFESNGAGGVFNQATELRLPGISRTELLNSLLAVLKPSGKAGKLSAIKKAHGYNYEFIAAEKGKVSSSWYATVGGHKKLIAALSDSVSGAGAHKLKLKLTAAGAKLFKAAKQIKVSADATFKAASGAKVSAGAKFTIG